jgi:hypothetical protein
MTRVFSALAKTKKQKGKSKKQKATKNGFQLSILLFE